MPKCSQCQNYLIKRQRKAPGEMAMMAPCRILIGMAADLTTLEPLERDYVYGNDDIDCDDFDQRRDVKIYRSKFPHDVKVAIKRKIREHRRAGKTYALIAQYMKPELRQQLIRNIDSGKTWKKVPCDVPYLKHDTRRSYTNVEKAEYKLKIRQMRAEKISYNEIARSLNLPLRVVINVDKNRAWKSIECHLPYNNIGHTRCKCGVAVSSLNYDERVAYKLKIRQMRRDFVPYIEIQKQIGINFKSARDIDIEKIWPEVPCKIDYIHIKRGRKMKEAMINRRDLTRGKQ